MCITLIFKNIKQPQPRKSWDQTKVILGNEIINVMPKLGKDFITSKIDSAHRASRNKYRTILPIIAKLSDFSYSEQVKSSLPLKKTPHMRLPHTKTMFYCYGM